MEPKKYEYIDSLRGIAILLVILTHVRQYLRFFPEIVNQFTLDGHLGVQLFFIVSAFTLTMSYHSRINEQNKTRNFFIRRFFRIAPLFYLAIIFSCYNILSGNYDRSHELSVFEVLASFLFINGFFPEYINSLVLGGWSITVEFTFYFCMPFICSKVKNLNSSILFFILTLLFATSFNKVLTILMPNDTTGFLFYNIIYQLPVFALGILAYWMINDKNKKVKPIIVLLGAFTVFFYCYFTLPRHVIYSLFFVLLLLTLYLKPYKILSNKILANIGKVSFSMYITHFSFVYLIRELKLITVTDTLSASINLVVSYVFVFVCSFLISQLTYRFIEQPGQNLGRKLIKKLNQQ